MLDVGNSIWERQRTMVDVSHTSAQTFRCQYEVPSSYRPCVRIPYSYLYSDLHEGLFLKKFTELGYF
jgi:hypothetical protein